MAGDQNCIDYREKAVLFAEHVAEHILDGHPEMEAYMDEVCDILADPDLVYSHLRTKTHWYYKLGVCTGREAGTYLLVIVGYNDAGDRWVKTSFPIVRPVETDAYWLIFTGDYNHDRT